MSLRLWDSARPQAGERSTPGTPPPCNLAALLLDAPAADSSGASPAGGTGKAIDWQVFAKLWPPVERQALPPLILAGGLTPGNVAEAIRLLRPWGVDVSSGVERQRGVKDSGLIRDFCLAVRQADELLT